MTVVYPDEVASSMTLNEPIRAFGVNRTLIAKRALTEKERSRQGRGKRERK